MDIHFKLAFVISLVYLVTKFLEMRFVMKKNKDMKVLFRDSLLVYFSVVVGEFMMHQLTPMSEMMSGGNATKAFTNAPNF